MNDFFIYRETRFQELKCRKIKIKQLKKLIFMHFANLAVAMAGKVKKRQVNIINMHLCNLNAYARSILLWFAKYHNTNNNDNSYFIYCYFK